MLYPMQPKATTSTNIRKRSIFINSSFIAAFIKIRRRLTKAKDQAKRQELERGEKVKNRDRGLER